MENGVDVFASSLSKEARPRHSKKPTKRRTCGDSGWPIGIASSPGWVMTMGRLLKQIEPLFRTKLLGWRIIFRRVLRVCVCSREEAKHVQGISGESDTD